MAPRECPFLAFVGSTSSDHGVPIVLYGAVGVVCNFITGKSVHERRQAAAASWAETDDTIHSLELCSAFDFGRDVSLAPTDLRFQSQTAELVAEAFSIIQLQYPEVLYGKTARDVPIVLAFSSNIARDVVAGKCPVVVLPRNGSQSLRLQAPTQTRVELDDLEPVGGVDDGDDGTWSRYKWPLPMHVLRLSAQLRNVEALPSALFHAACITAGPEQAFLDLNSMEGCIPSPITVLAWQVKMDMLEMIWQREQLSSFKGLVDRHLGADQSPQQGWQFLCARQQVYRTTAESVAVGGLSFEFSSTRFPCTVMGHGCGTVGDIVHRMLWVILLVAGSSIDVYRHQVRSWLTDQSKERKFPSSPASILHHMCTEKCLTNVDVDSKEPLLPHALEILDHCHILMNSLETAVKRMPWWDNVRESLSALCEFCGSRKHRDRFMEVCEAPWKLRIRGWRYRVPDWRWEVLEYVCEDVEAAWPLLQYFDEARMCGREKLSSALYKVAMRCLLNRAS